MKIKIDKKKCIGCGSCATVVEDRIEVEEVDGEMKAVVKKNEFDEGEVKELVEVCPVDAISKG